MAERNPRDLIEADFTDVGTDWVEIALDGPGKYIIRRARAELTAGDATTIAIRVRRRPTSSAMDTILKYDLTPIADMDSLEELTFIAKERSSPLNDTGTTYLAVKSNTTGNSVSAQLTVEIIP